MFYNDFYSLLERFSIMTVDGNIPDNEAYKILEKQTTKDLLNQLQVTVYKHNQIK